MANRHIFTIAVHYYDFEQNVRTIVKDIHSIAHEENCLTFAKQLADRQRVQVALNAQNRANAL